MEVQISRRNGISQIAGYAYMSFLSSAAGRRVICVTGLRGLYNFSRTTPMQCVGAPEMTVRFELQRNFSTAIALMTIAAFAHPSPDLLAQEQVQQIQLQNSDPKNQQRSA